MLIRPSTPHNRSSFLTVHDEVVCYVQKKRRKESVAVLKEAMEGFNMLSVPLSLEAKVATSWGDARVREGSSIVAGSCWRSCYRNEKGNHSLGVLL